MAPAKRLLSTAVRSTAMSHRPSARPPVAELVRIRCSSTSGYRAALAFPVLGPAGVVAVRQWVAAALLLTTVRPKFASFTRAQWRPVLALALIFAIMNLSLYLAIDRIGLGLAVTLEFLGPLSVDIGRA